MNNNGKKTNIDFELVRSNLNTKIFNITDLETEYSDEWLTCNSIIDAFTCIEDIIEQYESSKQSLLDHLDYNDDISNEAINKMVKISSSLLSNLASTVKETVDAGQQNINNLTDAFKSAFAKSYLAKVTTKSTGLNVRQGKGTDTQILVNVAKGSTLTVLDSTDKNWAYVELEDGTRGYVLKEYITKLEDGSETTIQDKTTNDVKYGLAMVTTEGSNLRVRAGRGTEYEILDRLPNGEVINVGESKDGWTEVKLKDGTIGYVSDDWIKRTDESMVTLQDKTTNDVKYGLATVTTEGSNLRVRAGRGTEYEILDRLPNGEVINVGKSKDGWTEVKLKDGTIGYVSNDWIKRNDGEQL